MPIHCAASCNNLAMIRELVEHGAAILFCTYNDNQVAQQKCEANEKDYDICSNYLLGLVFTE